MSAYFPPFTGVLGLSMYLACLGGCGSDEPVQTSAPSPAQAPVVAPLAFPGAPVPPAVRTVIQAYDDALAEASACSSAFMPVLDVRAAATGDITVDDERGYEAGVGRRVAGRHEARAIYLTDLKHPKASLFAGIECSLTGVWKPEDLDALAAHLNATYKFSLTEKYLAPLAKAGRFFEFADDGQSITVGTKEIRRSATVHFEANNPASQVIEVRIIDPRLFVHKR